MNTIYHSIPHKACLYFHEQLQEYLIHPGVMLSLYFQYQPVRIVRDLLHSVIPFLVMIFILILSQMFCKVVTNRLVSSIVMLPLLLPNQQPQLYQISIYQLSIKCLLFQLHRRHTQLRSKQLQQVRARPISKGSFLVHQMSLVQFGTQVLSVSTPPGIWMR